MKQLFKQPLRTADGSLSLFGFFWVIVAAIGAFMGPMVLINF
jgi:hypothetical protein